MPTVSFFILSFLTVARGVAEMPRVSPCVLASLHSLPPLRYGGIGGGTGGE